MSAGSHGSCSQGRTGQGGWELLLCGDKKCVCVCTCLVFMCCVFGVIIELLREQPVNKTLKKKPSTQCEVTLLLRQSLQRLSATASIKPEIIYLKQPQISVVWTGRETGFSFFSNTFNNNPLGLSLNGSIMEPTQWARTCNYTLILIASWNRLLPDVLLLHTHCRMISSFIQ